MRSQHFHFEPSVLGLCGPILRRERAGKRRKENVRVGRASWARIYGVGVDRRRLSVINVHTSPRKSNVRRLGILFISAEKMMMCITLF